MHLDSLITVLKSPSGPFLTALIVAIAAAVVGLTWEHVTYARRAKQSRILRDQTIGVDQIRDARLARLNRQQQGIDPLPRVSAVSERRVH